MSAIAISPLFGAQMALAISYALIRGLSQKGDSRDYARPMTAGEALYKMMDAIPKGLKESAGSDRKPYPTG
jgi:hypothetical protein